jgi:ribosomal protein S12 methylthiotransferase
MKITIIMLGCPKNDVDAETMLYLLKNAGHEIVEDPAEADVIIVNTCGFIKDAKQESVDMLLGMTEYRKTGNCKLLVATGCLTQRYKEQLFEALPEVDMMIGVNDYENIVQLVEGGCSSGRMLQCTDQIGSPSIAGRILTSPGSYAYLKIAEGCSNCCTYCAIPDIRGPYRSRNESEIIDEAEWLTDQGALELILIAQDITRYGMDMGGHSLTGLLKKLVRVDGLGRLRLLYCYPELITDELLELIHGEEKICSYIDVPLQHIDDTMLKRMNRRSSEAEIRSLIEKIRTNYDITLRTTFIVGFPGEGEEEYQKLRSFIQKARFDHLGVFEFSPEEGTPAYKMKPRVPSRTAKARRHGIMADQQQISREILAGKVGKIYRVLCDSISDTGDFICRSEGQSPEIDGAILLADQGNDYTGKFFNVQITESSEYDMRGIVI